MKVSLTMFTVLLAKVTLSLKPVGATPQLAIKNITAQRSKCLADISNMIKTKLGVKPGESVFIYVRSSFAPAPDARIADLYDVSNQ